MSLNPSDQPPDLASWDRLRRPIWMFDPVTLRGLYANPPALELWDAESLEELLGRDYSNLSESVLTRVRRLAAATADGGSITERWTFYPRGKPLTVQAVISSYQLDNGRDVLLFESAPIDVEEGERRAVEALRHTTSLITLFDADGRVVFANPAANAAYGLDDESFAARFAEPDQGRRVLENVLLGEVLSELCQMRTVKGERSHHLDVRQSLDPVTGATCVLMSERDVTAQVEAERALATAREREEVAVAKGRFLANMSHELRTPLNSVLGFSSLLATSGLSHTQADHVGHITQAGHVLLDIVNDVIALSEIDAGEVTLDQEAFEPAKLLGRVLDDFLPAAKSKGLVLKLQVEKDVPKVAVGDAARLKRVVSHYLSNAIKFTAEGGVVLHLAASAAGEESTAFEVAVIDTGAGVDDRTRARLFQRLTPGDDSMTKGVSGTGLGLALSKALIALMGGEVGVDSLLGQGSRFWFTVTLPTGCVEETDDGDARPLRILYADDHAANRAMIQAMLATQGHSCETVCDGAEAVSAARRGCYDLILMDIQMPVMDGVAAAREIRALPGPEGRVPILAHTANTLSDQLETYLAVGMNDCIAKPVSMMELITKITIWASGSVDAQIERAA